MTSTIEERRERARAWFEFPARPHLRRAEAMEDEAPADLYPGSRPVRLAPWTRETAARRRRRRVPTGRLFEKGGVHTSSANGRFSPEMAATMPGADQDPRLCLGQHQPDHPSALAARPAVHMNTRFLSTAESWFGGGADLTPVLDVQRRQDAPDAVAFHAAMQARLRRPRPGLATTNTRPGATSISSCPHRNEPRGIGGIFYDRHNPATSSATSPSPAPSARPSWTIYPKIVRGHMNQQQVFDLSCGWAVVILAFRIAFSSNVAWASLLDSGNCHLPDFHFVRGLPQGDFPQSDKRGFFEEILQRALGFFRRINHSTLQPINERARGQIHHNDFVSLFHDPIRDRLADLHPGHVLDLIVQALEVLDVYGGHDIDSSL